MTSFIIKRVLLLVPTLIGVSIGIFLMVRLLPGDIIDILLGGDITASEEVRQEAREQLGLTGSYPEQYWNWISGAVRGDFGDSLRNAEPVSAVLSDALPITLELVFLGLMIAVVFGVPLGVISAVRRDSSRDYGARVAGLVGVSVPNFWLATLLLLFTSKVFGWVPPLTYVSPLDDPIGEPQPVHPAGARDLRLHARDRDADGPRDDAGGARPGLRPHRPREGGLAQEDHRIGTRCATP